MIYRCIRIAENSITRLNYYYYYFCSYDIMRSPELRHSTRFTCTRSFRNITFYIYVETINYYYYYYSSDEYSECNFAIVHIVYITYEIIILQQFYTLYTYTELYNIWRTCTHWCYEKLFSYFFFLPHDGLTYTVILYYEHGGGGVHAYVLLL